MNGPREASKPLLGLALAVAIVPLLSTWSVIVDDTPTLLWVAGTAVAVLGAGIVCRLLRVPEAGAMAAEALVLVGVLAWLAQAAGGITQLPALVSAGIRHLVSSVAPVDPTTGTTVLLCLGAGILALLADWLAIALERPVTAVAPLLVALLIPALGPKVHRPPTVGLVWFALGMAAILLASHVEAGRRTASLRAAAAGIAAATTALALVGAMVLAPVVPVPPSARGKDGEPIQMTDVSLELNRQIRQGADNPAFDYTTDGDAGAYLRMYSLPTFNADGWKLTNSTVETGRLTAPPGLVKGTPRHTSVTITGLTTEWLPVPYAPTATSAGSDWGYLPDSLSILSLGIPDRTSATLNMSYTVDSLDARPSDEELATLAAGTPPDADVSASVPSDISPALVRIANQITRNEPTAGAKALAILRYLGGNGFTYSLDAQTGSGYKGLEDFLLRDRKGYCVQYAASMAILARIAGIPSRVAIGFTPGEQVGDHWTVTMHDMHAWPELFLEGWGWVSFEPTPGIAAGETETPETTPSPTPTAEPTAEPTETATATPTPTASPVAPGADGGLGGALPVLGVLLAVVAVGALVAAPGVLRGRQRRARLAGGRDPSVMALDAWDELRATARDYGRPWPPGSPRYAVEAVAGWVDDSSAARVRDLAIAAEQAQFGGPENAPAAGQWAATASGFASGLQERTPSRWQRLRARLFPASLFG